MTIQSMLLGCLIMAVVTYLCRVLTMVLFRKKITNKFIQSFLYYIPYSVLAVMIFPSIFFSTGYLISGIIGAVVALILSYFNRGLLIVSISSIATVYIVELIISLI